jgi:hypothetical protein
MPMRGPSFLILDLICYGITKKAMGFYVKILIGWPQVYRMGCILNLSKNHRQTVAKGAESSWKNLFFIPGNDD